MGLHIDDINTTTEPNQDHAINPVPLIMSNYLNYRIWLLCSFSKYENSRIKQTVFFAAASLCRWCPCSKWECRCDSISLAPIFGMIFCFFWPDFCRVWNKGTTNYLLSRAGPTSWQTGNQMNHLLSRFIGVTVWYKSYGNKTIDQPQKSTRWWGMLPTLSKMSPKMGSLM